MLALMVTWFDNAVRDTGIIRRNATMYPGFMPVTPLEVLVQ